MVGGLKLSLCTRFKDRLSHLSQTLPTWVKISGIDEFIITDYNSQKDNVIPLLRSINDKRVVLLRVPNVQGFDRGKCHNIGISHAQGDIILNVDGDIFFSPLILGIIKPEDKDHKFHTIGEQTKPRIGCYGTCIFFKNMWKAVNGYVEGFNSWGYEDTNFYARLVRAGYRRIPDITSLKHITHGDELRFQHHDYRRKDSTRMQATLRAVPKIMQIHTYHTIGYGTWFRKSVEISRQIPKESFLTPTEFSLKRTRPVLRSDYLTPESELR